MKNNETHKRIKRLGILHLPVNTFLVPRLCRLSIGIGGRAAKYAFPGRAWEREKMLTSFQQI